MGRDVQRFCLLPVVEDGQVVETWVVRDRLGMLQQLGVAPE